MAADPSERPRLEAAGLHRIATGATIGLGAGIVGLLLPILVILLTAYAPRTLVLRGPQLVQVTAILALAGALLFAVSLMVYRFGFMALQRLDRRFWSATLLCLLGTFGVLLIVLAIGLAFLSSDAMANCIQGAPTHALACLGTAAPLASYSGLVGFWLLWLGGLGIVVGILLAGNRYHQGWFLAGAGLYTLLLLGLIAPALSLLFPIDPPAFPLLVAPLLALLAPATIFHACERSHAPARAVGETTPADPRPDAPGA